MRFQSGSQPGYVCQAKSRHVYLHISGKRGCFLILSVLFPLWMWVKLVIHWLYVDSTVVKGRQDRHLLLSNQIVKLIMQTASSSIAVNFSPINCNASQFQDVKDLRALTETVLSIQIACVSTAHPTPHPIESHWTIHLFVNGGLAIRRACSVIIFPQAAPSCIVVVILIKSYWGLERTFLEGMIKPIMVRCSSCLSGA